MKKEQILGTASDQFNGDLNYFVKDMAVEAYETAQETSVEDTKLDTEQLIDTEMAAKSEKLEALLKDKEELMLNYFMSLRTGDQREMERIKKLIKDVSEEAYQSFIVDIDAKIIAILKTLDMEALVAEKNSTNRMIEEEKAEQEAVIAPMVEKVVKPTIAPVIPVKVVEPTTVAPAINVAEVVVPVVEKKIEVVKKVGSFDPANTDYMSNLTGALGVGKVKEKGTGTIVVDAPVIPVAPIVVTPPVQEKVATETEESITSGWGVTPKTPLQPVETIKEEMERKGIKPIIKKEVEPLATRVASNGLIITMNPQGQEISIGDLIFAPQQFFSVNYSKQRTAEEIWDMEEKAKVSKVEDDLRREADGDGVTGVDDMYKF